jgi:RimJ/RimL family protein N-acetyltransferase
MNERMTPEAPSPQPLFPDLTRDDVFRLETPRLWLRWQRLTDAPALHSFASLRDVAEMTGTWPHPLPTGEPERRIFRSRQINASGTGLIMAITPRDKPGQQIGWIALFAGINTDTTGDVELGYMLHPQHRGKGLVVEAAQSMLDTAFGYTLALQVQASVRVINPASRRVLEKCGFRHSGTALHDQPARGGMIHCDQFVLDRKTWAALVGWSHSVPPVPATRPNLITNVAAGPPSADA